MYRKNIIGDLYVMNVTTSIIQRRNNTNLTINVRNFSGYVTTALINVYDVTTGSKVLFYTENVLLDVGAQKAILLKLVSTDYSGPYQVDLFQINYQTLYPTVQVSYLLS
ncbi:MAG: hypothetical protein ACRC7N_04365 [Clostridium sp.]